MTIDQIENDTFAEQNTQSLLALSLNLRKFIAPEIIGGVENYESVLVATLTEVQVQECKLAKDTV